MKFASFLILGLCLNGSLAVAEDDTARKERILYVVKQVSDGAKMQCLNGVKNIPSMKKMLVQAGIKAENYCKCMTIKVEADALTYVKTHTLPPVGRKVFPNNDIRNWIIKSSESCFDKSEYQSE